MARIEMERIGVHIAPAAAFVADDGMGNVGPNQDAPVWQKIREHRAQCRACFSEYVRSWLALNDEEPRPA